MAVIPQAQIAPSTGLIAKVAGAQNMMIRAKDMQIRQERHQMDKEKFGAELITLDLQQQTAALNVKSARINLMEKENGLDARMLEMDNKEHALRQSGRVRALETAQADKARGDFQKMQDLLHDQSISPIKRQRILDTWVTTNQNLATSKLNPAIQSEMGQLIAQAGATKQTLQGEYVQRVTEASSTLSPRLNSVQSEDDLFRVTSSPEFQYASQNPEFLKAVETEKKYFRDIRLAEAKAGSNRPNITSEVGRKLQAFITVSDDLGVLEDMIEDVNSLRLGPIAGRVGGLNPYDVQLKKLEAFVEGTVPTLARGVFGEVGVLTDADVARYTRQLPNAKSSPKVAKALLEELRERLDRGYDNAITFWDDAGYDVGNLRNTLANKKAKRQGMTTTVSDGDL